jgi:hypothetical protein
MCLVVIATIVTMIQCGKARTESLPVRRVHWSGVRLCSRQFISGKLARRAVIMILRLHQLCRDKGVLLWEFVCWAIHMYCFSTACRTRNALFDGPSKKLHWNCCCMCRLVVPAPCLTASSSCLVLAVHAFCTPPSACLRMTSPHPIVEFLAVYLLEAVVHTL